MTLSGEQRQAAHAGPLGAILIAAGPGTGKTFTMAERFCWLVETIKAPPTSILAVTFTDKAALELRERIARLLLERGLTSAARELDAAWIGTFHGVCTRLLSENAYLVGAPRELRVLDDVGQRLFQEEMKRRLLSGEQSIEESEAVTALTPEDVDDLLKRGLDFALKLKGRGVSPAQFHERALKLWDANNIAKRFDAPMAEKEAIEILHAVYSFYEGQLQEGQLADFDDLILRAIRALESVPAFRAQCRQRFQHILVDEFQDTNKIQLDLIRLLAADNFENVAAVGDLKQSIYGWRDADIENIRTRFPGRHLPLTRNHRSRQEICNLATDFIRRDIDFAGEPDLTAERGAGGRVRVVMAADSGREARLVAAEISRLRREGRRLGDIAILASSVRYLPSEFEDELRLAGIPYVTSGGAGFFDREEVKDVVALLRLVDDPLDDGALVRVLQGPVIRISDRGLYRLARRRLSVDEEGRRRTMHGKRLRDCLADSAVEGWPEFEPASARRTEAVLSVTDALGRKRDTLTVADLLNRLLEDSGYLRHVNLRAAREGPRGLLNLRKVYAMANRFERDAVLAGVSDFVRHLDEIMAAEIPVGEALEEAPDAVSLLTIHTAKGLEFPVVFLVNVKPPRARETERFFYDPDKLGLILKWWRGSIHPRHKREDPGREALVLSVQERRRTVYVGITRARDELYITASRPEARPEDIDPGTDDHFAEILQWALQNPDAADVISAEEPELAVALTRNEVSERATATVEAVLARLEQIDAGLPRHEMVAVAAPRALSFSQLHQFDLCPVRYRFAEVLRLPAAPDELLPKRAQTSGSTELGAAIHSALAAWHSRGGDLLSLYSGPDPGRDILERYLATPLAATPTIGVELDFNLRLGDTRVRGIVDRVCMLDGRTTLIDYKTNASLDAKLIESYSVQLRLYGLAAKHGLLPGGDDPRLMLYDLRNQKAIEVTRDDGGVEALIASAAERIAAGDFALRAEHANRPCFMCSYKPVCPDART